MILKCLSNIVVGILLTGILTQSAFSMPSIQEAFTSKYSHLKNSPLDSCTTCHMPNIKNGLNRYAIDLKKHKVNFKKVERLDSDKDKVKNITEIKRKTSPGSKNPNFGQTFIYKNEKGDVHFNHGAHISKSSYGINFNCSKCHTKNAFAKEYGTSSNFKDRSHKQCLDCHTKSGQKSKKVAKKCSQCHKGSLE